MANTLGRLLKRKGITRKEFHKVLTTMYDYNVGVQMVQEHCSKECPSPYPCWDVIQKCLKEQYGIIYDNGVWKEVRNDGERK